MRDFDRLLRESQREVLRLQRQIALRNQREPPPPPRPPGPAAPARGGAPAPGAPGEVSTGARAGVWRWGWERLGDHRLHRAQSPEDAAVAWALRGLGDCPHPASRTCTAPGGLGVHPPQPRSPRAGPAAPAAPPVVRPGSKSPVALAAARGPARASASRRRRRRRSAGTPPSAPAWSARPGPATQGRRCPPRLQVWATLTGRWA